MDRIIPQISLLIEFLALSTTVACWRIRTSLYMVLDNSGGSVFNEARNQCYGLTRKIALRKPNKYSERFKNLITTESNLYSLHHFSRSIWRKCGTLRRWLTPTVYKLSLLTQASVAPRIQGSFPLKGTLRTIQQRALSLPWALLLYILLSIFSISHHGCYYFLSNIWW